ncbi:MAG TPA: hypothetical protein VFR28_11590, partial [Allosphingosinicella sp.]|nr:hypothetical protein [Allosphingosinicella sp.]
MANKMLIDASHPEETRVVVTRGQKVEEFDFESASRRQLRGNIYLAKVIRVEPSLQAAFVEYGGNRHGFLAFGEIHPDYSQIPVADRQALLEEDARAERDSERDEERRRDRGRGRNRSKAADTAETIQGPIEGTEGKEAAEAAREEGQPEGTALHADDSTDAGEPDRDLDSGADFAPTEASFDAGDAPEEARQPAETDDDGQSLPSQSRAEEASEHAAEGDAGAEAGGTPPDTASGEHDDEEHEEPVIEQVGHGDALEEISDRPRRPRRQYKIQEVIKR